MPFFSVSRKMEIDQSTEEKLLRVRQLEKLLSKKRMRKSLSETKSQGTISTAPVSKVANVPKVENGGCNIKPPSLSTPGNWKLGTQMKLGFANAVEKSKLREWAESTKLMKFWISSFIFEACHIKLRNSLLNSFWLLCYFYLIHVHCSGSPRWKRCHSQDSGIQTSAQRSPSQTQKYERF